MLADIQQIVCTAIAEQIKALTSNSQKSAVVTNVASSIAQTSGIESQSVAPTSLILTTELDGLSSASAVLTVYLATITTATVPTMSYASSRAVSIMTSAGPCGPIMTVVHTNGYVTGHPVKETVIEPKVDRTVETKF